MAISAKMIDWNGKASGEAALPKKAFEGEIKNHVVFDSVLALKASRRQGTASTKTRAMVAGGGRKPYRQKGTGNARQGSITAPNFTGGGIVFGPSPRDYAYQVPKKVRKQAMVSALTDKANSGKVVVTPSFDEKKPSTKSLHKWLSSQGIASVLFVGSQSKVLELSVRNLPRAGYAEVKSLNVYDVLRHEHLVISVEAMAQLEERLAS